jgi:hypothetical protein
MNAEQLIAVNSLTGHQLEDSRAAHFEALAAEKFQQETKMRKFNRSLKTARSRQSRRASY